STTDHVGPMGISSGTSDTQYIYYYDSVGYSTSQHRISGSSNHRPTIYFQNQSLSNPIACAFNILPQGTALPLESAGGGLGIVLSNNYLGAYNLAFQGGAVISQAYGGIPVMIDPPAFTFSTNATGNSARLVMINLVATNASQSESGYSTAGITTRLLSELTFQSTVPFGAGASQLGGPTLNVSTYFPAAWSSYFGSLSSTYTGGSGAVQCYSPVAFSAPYSCLDPPAGTPVYVSVPLSVQSVTVVLATVSVVID
ncbi:MAG TPA: hypothetical protein VMH90_05890, partial [Thermoplasmata archaeon]|nr:hypothetical protein [Thermoplasmata archaeon]